ncbi:MAG: Hsp70 family protein, partial [Gammaproteobacteria bacterium]
AKVTLLGGGARLVGGARSAELTRREALAIALDGFFPLSSIDDLPDRKRGGIVEFGLPYAAEPAVSRHIAAFLHHYRHAAQDALEGEGFIPDAVLLNGGVFRSKKIVRRLLDLISSWRGGGVRHLDNPHPELAVAYGAVGYALARRGKQPKIGGGSARSYYLILDDGEPEIQRGVCILPRGTEEGGEIILQDRQFALRLGRPVRFNLASLSGDADHKAGDIAEIDEDRFHLLPPLAVSLKRKESGEQTEAAVRLSVMLTEIGTLRIQCVSIENPKRRWDVEFQIRNKPGKSESVQAVLPAGFSGAAESVSLVFGKKSRAVDAKSVRNLRNELEKRLGLRAEWDSGLLRSLFTEFLDGMKYRRRSPAHERVWLNLAGFCLRPGFGYPLDDWRVEQLWEIYPQQIQFVNEAQNWAEWWTLWRRVAGGLSAEAQEKIFSDLAKYIDPASARQPAVAKQIKSRGYEDMVRLAAVLEHLAAERKIRLGEWLLKRLKKTGEPEQSWWALGRVGARVPFHGSSHNAVPPETASAWLDAVLAADWKKNPQAGFAATMIARMSGDRARDIDDGLRGAVLDRLRRDKTPSAWQAMVEQVRELDEKEEGRIFGESLPPGLKLI